MPNPYKIYDRNQGPPWLKQLDKYIENAPPVQEELRRKDNDALIRNHGGDRDILDKATYTQKKGRK